MAVNAASTQGQDSEAHEGAEAKGPSVQFLTFTVGEESYAVNIMIVREIKGWQETTRLPNSPQYMRGVINLRGVIIPIFDLRARFAMGMTEAHDKHVVIILAVGERIIGILVDAVSDILTVNTGDIRAAPAMQVNIDDAFVEGLISVEERMVVVLDVEHLFDAEVLESAAKVSQEM